MKFILLILLSGICTYFVSGFYDVNNQKILFKLLIEISSILLTMIGIWFAVVYNNILEIFHKDISIISDKELLESREFVLSIFYLAFVLVVSIVVLFVLHGLPVDLDNVNVYLQISFFLLAFLVFIVLYVLKSIVIPFGKLVIRLEVKISHKKIRNSKDILRQKKDDK